MREADVLEREGGVGGGELQRGSSSSCWFRSWFREVIRKDVNCV